MIHTEFTAIALKAVLSMIFQQGFFFFLSCVMFIVCYYYLVTNYSE